MVWLSAWSEVQTACIWSSWCHCHPQTPSPLASFLSQARNDGVWGWQWHQPNRTQTICISHSLQTRVVHGLGWPMGSVVLGRVGSRLFTCGGLGSVRSTTAKVLKISKDYVDAFKARLDKIWLCHEGVISIVTVRVLWAHKSSPRLNCTNSRCV